MSSLTKIKLNDNFWDCECKTNYIHFKTVDRCSRCDAFRDEQPNSRVNEIDKWLGSDCCNLKEYKHTTVWYDNMAKVFWVSNIEGNDLERNFKEYEDADSYAWGYSDAIEYEERKVK